MSVTELEKPTPTLTRRTTCRLCLSTRVKVCIPFKPTPLAEKYTTERSEATQPLYPIDLYQCSDCGHVQVLDVIDSKTLWDDYTYHSGQTAGILRHFKTVADNIIDKFKPAPKGFIIDVGSNDGSFLEIFQQQGYRTLGIDPATEIAAKATENGIKTLPERMTRSVGLQVKAQHGQADIVTAFNVFAHADDMIDLLSGIVEILSPNGLLVIECSYLKDIIEQMLVGTIFHEHLCHHSLLPLQRFLNSAGLALIDVQPVSIQGGSLICYAQPKTGNREVLPSVARLLREEQLSELHSKATMDQFYHQLLTMREQVSSIISEFTTKAAAKNSHIAGYGAARSGPMLLAQFDIGSVVTEIYDDHPQKVGLYSPGHQIPIKPTATINERRPVLVVILAWIHAKKIIRKHLDYLEQGGCFLLLTPRIQLVFKENHDQYL